MQAWEYRVELFTGPGGHEVKLCELGARGWELVAVAHSSGVVVAYFKRSLIQ